MSRGLTRAERLREMERLYVQQAFSDIEMAARLGVDRTTVYRDRLALEAEYPFLPDENGRWKIDRTRYLSGIKVNLHEALALYLAARRASRQTRTAQPHLGNALEKLSSTLRQPMTEKLVRAAANILDQHSHAERVEVVEAITQAWVERRKVRITHRALRSPRSLNYLVCPYLIEPSLWSDGAYLIGFSDVHGDLATFKIERIEKAVLSGETFSIPEDFDEGLLFKYAWGIWYGENEPFTVRLRFAPGQAARRLEESIWHPTQSISVTPEGGCIWTAQVAEWQEMLPWIRGWGADVEVLEPQGLREVIADEMRRAVLIYENNNKSGNQYYAHSNEYDKSRWQTLHDHLTNTAQIALKLGEDAGLSDFAYPVALLHDIGKYSLAFQRRLSGNPKPVDHATAGAKEIRKLSGDHPNTKLLGTLMAYCIAGHHGGIPDYGSPIDEVAEKTLLARLKREVEDYGAYASEIDITNVKLPKYIPIKPITKGGGFSVSFFTRMLYSILVDADFIETETFMNQGEKPRGGYDNIQTLTLRFNKFLERFEKPRSPIDEYRTKILKACITKAVEKPGLFRLTVPTGGGKTLASMAFALNHASANGLKRIIYVIPYTSIIEQNAAVFKEALGGENILEHHSNFDFKGKKYPPEAPNGLDGSVLAKLRLAAENWDIPIIVTTNVQFFESLYSNRSSRSRKLHNLAKSVLIFDETQMLPREYMKPCMYAVSELVRNYSATAVFCTATQPVVEKFLPIRETPQELAPDPLTLYEFFKRVRVRDEGQLTDQDLLGMIQNQTQALCIVNTRKHAKGLFEGLAEEGRYHLSSLMCPAHRKETIAKIRERLKDGSPCRVISTQIIEAGVDLDFPVGYRALSGLDSIIQSAGRVNRENKKSGSEMVVFEPLSDFARRTPGYIQQTAEVAKNILRKYSSGDPVSLEAIKDYYHLLYDLQDPKAFDRKEILDSFEKPGVIDANFDFQTAAQKFKLIEENTVSVIIKYNQEVEETLEKARYSNFPLIYSRELQPYTVNIYEQEYQSLLGAGLIDTYNDVYAVLNNPDYYNEETGIVIPESRGGEAIYF